MNDILELGTLDEASGDLFVMRCKGSNTIPLSLLIQESGVRCIVPVWHQRRRVSRLRRVIVATLPVLPSFLFSSAPHYALPKEIARDCSPMLFNGRAVRVSSESLFPVMSYGQTTREKKSLFSIGNKVRITGGLLVGSKGTVIAESYSFVTVEIKDSSLKVKIPPFLLELFRA